MKRISKSQYYMSLVNVVKLRSHDAETQAGAVLIKKDTGAVIATGFNGFVRGANDAALPNTRPEKYKHIIHAEENLIAHCARHGISMSGCEIYINFAPCEHCARLLWQCGIDTIIIESTDATPSFKKYFEAMTTMKDIAVKMTTTPEHHTVLKLKSK